MNRLPSMTKFVYSVVFVRRFAPFYRYRGSLRKNPYLVEQHVLRMNKQNTKARVVDCLEYWHIPLLEKMEWFMGQPLTNC